MVVSLDVRDLLDVAWAKGLVVRVEHFRHIERRAAALGRLQAHATNGGHGIIAIELGSSREGAEQLVDVAAHLTAGGAEAKVRFRHAFVGITPRGDALPVLATTDAGPQGAVTAPIAVSNGRSGALWAEAYYVLVGPSRRGQQTEFRSSVRPGEDPCELIYRAVDVVIEDAHRVRKSPEDYDSMIAVARVKPKDRGLEVEQDWIPAVARLETAFAFSYEAWAAFRQSLSELLRLLQSTAAPTDAGPDLRAREAAWALLCDHLERLDSRMSASSGLRLEDSVTELWEPIASWERRNRVLLRLGQICDEELFRATMKLRHTSELWQEMSATLGRLVPFAQTR